MNGSDGPLTETEFVIRIIAEDFKSVPVIFVQAVLSAEPHVSTAVLTDGEN